MAVTITLTIPNGSVAIVKAALEYYDQRSGLLEVGQVYTPAQAAARMKQLCVERVREIVRIYRSDVRNGEAAASVNSDMAALEVT